MSDLIYGSTISDIIRSEYKWGLQYIDQKSRSKCQFWNLRNFTKSDTTNTICNYKYFSLLT